MSERKISPRHSSAILQAFSNGVTPRIGLEHVVVGRKAETEAMLDDLDYRVAKGGASFRLIVGPYGSGKSFMLQVIRNYALQRNFVVADADLSAERRLTGTGGQGVSLYRELLSLFSCKSCAIFMLCITIIQRQSPTAISNKIGRASCRETV